MSATPLAALEDPVGTVVDLVCAHEPALGRGVVEDIIVALSGHRAARRRLAGALLERPDVLIDGRSPAPRIVGELLVALRRAGARTISAPRCTACHKELRSFQRRAADWYCSVCIRPRRACASCGAVRQVHSVGRHGEPRCEACPVEHEDPLVVVSRVVRGVDPGLDEATITAALQAVTTRAGQRRQLAWALEDRPSLLTGTGAQAPVPSVLRLIDALCAAGARGVVPPPCPHCRRVVRLSKLRDGLRMCRGCEARLRAVPCGRCGKRRDPVTRDDEGRPLCGNCFIRDPANHEVCVGCGRRRPVSVRSPEGPRCETCRPRTQGTCTICARRSEIEISKVTGEPWCRACQKRWAGCSACGQLLPVRGGTRDNPLCGSCTRPDPLFWKGCPRCGEPATLDGGTCARCRLRQRLEALLGGSDGIVRPQLVALCDSLTAERPDSVLGWLRRGSVSRVLAAFGSGELAIAHESLDELPASKVTEHLRAVLVATGALVPRDEQMVRLERWVTTVIAGRTEPGEQELLRRYGIWHLLRRLRRRNQGTNATYGQTQIVKRHLRAALALLDWLGDRGLTLDTACQGHLDSWLASDGATRRRDAGHFVRWAAREKLTTLELPAERWGGPNRAVDGEQRWRQARWLLADGAVDPSDRVAGLLVLLYAQRAAGISRLTIDHVDVSGDGVRLRLGARPLAVPEPLAAMVVDLMGTRRGHATLGDQGTSRWLFPGGQPGRPISASRMTERLRALGILAGPARSAALLQLATELPAAVIARLLGVHIKVAVEWQRISSGDWATYAADYSRRPIAHPQSPQ